MKLKKLVFYNKNNPNKEVFITSKEARRMVMELNKMIMVSPSLET